MKDVACHTKLRLSYMSKFISHHSWSNHMLARTTKIISLSFSSAIMEILVWGEPKFLEKLALLTIVFCLVFGVWFECRHFGLKDFMTRFCLTSRFLGLVLIYLVVGSAYQYFGKQERGIRILPNYDFWKAFGGYVWVSTFIPQL